MQPCLDDFHTTFDDYAEMQVYHARQARESKWARKTVSGLHIEPLDEASPLYTDGKAFAPNVSQVAVNDTAKNLGLALLTENGYLPIRNTAYKSLLDRAKSAARRCRSCKSQSSPVFSTNVWRCTNPRRCYWCEAKRWRHSIPETNGIIPSCLSTSS